MYGNALHRAPRAGHFRIARLLLALALLVASPTMRAANAPVTLDEAFASPLLIGTEPSPPQWAPDSRHFAFTWNDAGLPMRQLWIARRDGSDLRRLGGDDASVRDLAWLAGGDALLVLRGDALWRIDIATGRETRIAETGAGAAGLTLSPRGDSAAFLRDGDLWRVDLASGDVSALTRVGLPSLSSLPVGRYRRPEREIGPGIWGGPTYRWSPDGATIAVHHVDRRGMRRVPFPDYLAADTNPNEVRRGYPGDANEARRVGLVDVATARLSLLDLDEPTARQVVDFHWSPTGELLIDQATDTATDRWLLTVTPGQETAPRVIWHSERASRIYTDFAAAWHPDGERVIVLDDAADRYGLYLLDPDGERGAARLSDPAFDVLGAPTIDAASRSLFFAGNGAGPQDQHVYRVSLDGGAVRQLTRRPGYHTGYPAPDGSVLVTLSSDDTTPPELYVLSTDDAGERRVTHSPQPAFAGHDWVPARYVTFPSRIDDYVLHARILEPRNLDRGHRHPVVFGPMYSNTVRNRWRGVYSLVQQMLVQRGYIVVQVDVRGSTGYGRDFREEFLVDFAGEDIEDIASAVDYLSTLPWIDTDRLGIWGSSYGGTLSVYTLLKKPGLFRAGVAAAAAVDPFFFGTDDVAIVRRPDTAPDVFANTARRYAANLQDNLLFIHGMQDHVVPFKTVISLADELIRQGKNFDMAIGPGASHAWSREPYYSRYLFGKLFEFFDRHLAADRAGELKAPAGP